MASSIDDVTRVASSIQAMALQAPPPRDEHVTDMYCVVVAGGAATAGRSWFRSYDRRQADEYAAEMRARFPALAFDVIFAAYDNAHERRLHEAYERERREYKKQAEMAYGWLKRAINQAYCDRQRMVIDGRVHFDPTDRQGGTTMSIVNVRSRAKEASAQEAVEAAIARGILVVIDGRFVSYGTPRDENGVPTCDSLMVVSVYDEESRDIVDEHQRGNSNTSSN